MIKYLILVIILAFAVGCEHVVVEPADRVVTPNVQKQSDELQQMDK